MERSIWILLSLYESDKRLNELNERLLTFGAALGARCGWFGLRAGEDAAGRRRRGAAAEVAGKTGQEGALEGDREESEALRGPFYEKNVRLLANIK